MPRWQPARSVPRMSSPRSLLALWARAPVIQSVWQATARYEATYEQSPQLRPDARGGLDPYEEEVWKTQAEMFVRQVAGRNERGMTWRLSWLEAEMGLPDGGRMGLDYTSRRDRFCARLRSWRLPTPNAIRLVAQAYGGNDVQTSVDYPHHHMIVRFTGKALPENLAALQAEIIRLAPARLGRTSWVIAFLTWGDVADSLLTWCQPEDAGWTWQNLEESSVDELPTDVVCAET